MAFRVYLGAAALFLTFSPLAAFSQLTPWESYNKAGFQAFESGNYLEAENDFLDGLSQAEQFGEEDQRLLVALNNLARLYVRQGKTAAAESLESRALAVGKSIYGEGSKEVALILCDLGGLYNQEGKYSEAQSVLQEALTIQEKELDPDEAAVAISMNNLATVYLGEHKYSEAEDLYQRALGILEKSPESQDSDVTLVLRNWA